MVLEGVVKHISTSVQFTSVFASTSATPCSNIHTCNAQDVLKSVGGRGGAGGDTRRSAGREKNDQCCRRL